MSFPSCFFIAAFHSDYLRFSFGLFPFIIRIIADRDIPLGRESEMQGLLCGGLVFLFYSYVVHAHVRSFHAQVLIRFAEAVLDINQRRRMARERLEVGETILHP